MLALASRSTGIYALGRSALRPLHRNAAAVRSRTRVLVELDDGTATVPLAAVASILELFSRRLALTGRTHVDTSFYKDPIGSLAMLKHDSKRFSNGFDSRADPVLSYAYQESLVYGTRSLALAKRYSSTYLNREVEPDKRN